VPVRIEALEDAVPVQRLGAGAQDVRDVGAVVAFALHHERLLPEQLFDRRDLHRHTEDVRLEGELEPEIVHLADAVAGAEYEIHDVAALSALASQCGNVTSV
jgi:hypothetical protein